MYLIALTYMFIVFFRIFDSYYQTGKNRFGQNYVYAVKFQLTFFRSTRISKKIPTYLVNKALPRHSDSILFRDSFSFLENGPDQ